jgi:TonB-linked SusC/RagA family outer membrane protein
LIFNKIALNKVTISKFFISLFTQIYCLQPTALLKIFVGGAVFFKNCLPLASYILKFFLFLHLKSKISMKKLSLILAMVVSTISLAFAQRTVTGTVVDPKNEALVGASVLVKGTTTGTVTDVDGKFSLAVPANATTLSISFAGFQSQDIALGASNVVDVTLAESTLAEVVVTAIGIQRDKKAVGYAVSDVGSDQIAQKSEPDVLRTLANKVPGVNVIGGGGSPGQGTKINIRGASSFDASTQPLFVVDGIPFDNSVNASSGFSSGSTFSNRAYDIDPNTVESMTVLKGAAAAALYGSRATNGVIVITTKSGTKKARKGLEITYNSSYSTEQISALPDYQNTYTQGSNQNYNGGFIGNWGSPFPEYVDQINKDNGTVYSKTYSLYRFGPNKGKPYPDGTAEHPLALRNPDFCTLYPDLCDADGNGKAVQLTNHDIVGGFFGKGLVTENSLNFSAGDAKASIVATISRSDNKGMIPNSNISRTNVSFGGQAQLNNGFRVRGTVSYVNTAQENPQSGASFFEDYGGGTGGSIYSRIFYLPRNFNLNNYPFERPNGNNLFYRALDNPLWTAKYNKYSSNVNRAIGNIDVSYPITDWLTVGVRGGLNTYYDARRNEVRPGGTAIPLGRVWTDDLNNTEVDITYTAQMNKQITDDINLSFLLGHNANQRTFRSKFLQADEIIQPDLLNTNAAATQRVFTDRFRQKRIVGTFADASIGYKNYLYFNANVRNDRSSTLPKANNSYWYYSASGSFVFTELFKIPGVDYGKLRLGYAKVGNDADPYRTANVYNFGTSFVNTAGVNYNVVSSSNVLNNVNLKPEFSTEFEIGADVQLLKKRIGLDFTYYARNSKDLIVAARVPSSSGFQYQIDNVGEISNKGIEIGLTLRPIQTSNGFNWEIYNAFTKNISLVVSAGNVKEVFIGGANSALGTIHREGLPYGQIFGSKNATSPSGQLLINPSTGRPFSLPSSDIIGDPNPEFVWGITNKFSFRGVTLGAVFEYKKGGDMYSVTAASLLLRGQLANSANDREALRAVPGVLGDPQTYQPILVDGKEVTNTIGISAFDFHFTEGFGAYGADETNVYDATVVRLREVSLGYELPKKLLKKTPFGSIAVTLTGRNLWFNAPNFLKGLNFDPEVLGNNPDTNIQGFDFGAAPTTKRFGINLSVTF